MTNVEFLKVLKDSFKVYLKTSARSNKKLEVLHGAIAKDLHKRLGNNYQIKSLGFGTGKEAKINGRYMEKAVDISIFKSEKALGGVAVKYIMSNYSQNSNNYFEGMLGETANLRTTSKAYFQIVALPKHVPYFKKDGTISKIETITAHNIEKYLKLSQDDVTVYMHTPTKTLFYLIDTPTIPLDIVKTKSDYIKFLLDKEDFEITLCNDKYNFKDSIVYNDYENFINKVVNYIKFLG